VTLAVGGTRVGIAVAGGIGLDVVMVGSTFGVSEGSTASVGSSWAGCGWQAATISTAPRSIRRNKRILCPLWLVCMIPL
jgi:hypothetical protein